MSLRNEQCNKVCRILDDVLANRPTERDSLITAVRKAFGALETEPPWIPITERLPEEPGVYTVTNNDYEVVRYTFSGSDTSREYWERCVKAWLPLPKAYVED